MNKVMTQEEKAKAYDEAIERAKKLHGKYCINNVLESLFPELKESEDERVRKELIEFVRQSSEVLDKQNQNNMIAWLEKQGESYTKRDVDDAFVEGMYLC